MSAVTSDQIIELTKILLPAMLAFLAMTGTIVTGLFAYKSSKKADVIIEKAAEIHQLTNSHLSKVTAALEVANTKIESMGQMIAGLLEDKKTSETVAERLAEKAAAITITDAPTSTIDLKENVIEGTLETKDPQGDTK